MNLDYKLIALDSDEWLKEKENFIKNKKVERKFINEDILKEDITEVDSTIGDAQDIFGDIIEIK